MLGCEKYEDMGAVVKFTCPYVFVHAEQKWFRLTGGHPSEQLSNMTVRLFSVIYFRDVAHATGCTELLMRKRYCFSHCVYLKVQTCYPGSPFFTFIGHGLRSEYHQRSTRLDSEVPDGGTRSPTSTVLPRYRGARTSLLPLLSGWSRYGFRDIDSLHFGVVFLCLYRVLSD